ncbi:endonuclease [Mycobacterium sp. MS1601]|uniref:endonuclease n=1 Tax=Mycobacterium sp. MS1601 TaxID=1936029 RepID=UPI0009795EDB|nr:endonuclease [Mycobacterium sp. MS1601]AQA05348.1 endonuclease [Mycobacterium sp. MS1601]
MATPEAIARDLLNRRGTTYASAAGITLEDAPKPLFQLLVLCMLASKPIHSDVAARAAHALFSAGLRTPKAVLDADRRTVITAFGDAGYARYDESSADRLAQMAAKVSDDYGGDLRNLAEAAGHDIERTSTLLRQFTGIGQTGAGIFLREVQAVWPWVQPYFDNRAREQAQRLGLPTDAAALAALAPEQTPELAAALVRASLTD